MVASSRGLEKEIINFLVKEKKPLTTEHICRTLNIPKDKASYILYRLLKNGVLKRVYTESYDPTRPFDTASWVVAEAVARPAEEAGAVKAGWPEGIRLVLSIPLSMLDSRTYLLNRYEALDFHEAYAHIIELAKRELKIMCPIIDAYALYPLVVRIVGSKKLRIKILTEIEKSKDLFYLMDSLSSRSVEVRDVERKMRHQERERKTFGIHAKMIIADDDVALIGSFNLARYHYLVNFDVGFLVYNTAVVKKLSLIFDEMWRNSADV